MDVDGTGAAKRRWERRLRALLRQDRQTVAMEFAAALHHSPDARPNETHSAPRRQTTASSGTRFGVLTEPEPQEAAVTVGHVAAAVALLAQPFLGGGNTLDMAAVQFLLAQRKEAEEREVKEAEKKAKVEEQRMLQIDAMIAEGHLVSEKSHAAWLRWQSFLFLIMKEVSVHRQTVDIPVVPQRRARTVQVMQKVVEIPQVQSSQWFGGRRSCEHAATSSVVREMTSGKGFRARR